MHTSQLYVHEDELMAFRQKTKSLKLLDMHRLAMIVCSEIAQGTFSGHIID